MSDGVLINDSTGAPITATDDSDSGADPSGSNPDERGDMGTPDDPTPLLIPSIGLAKVAGEAVPNGDNFDVTFTLNWQNTGNVALNGVEILDDIMDQFGGQFAGATIDSVTTSGTATVVANPAWGTADTAPSLISHTGDPLAVGDTIQVVFTVTIDPDASGTATGGLENQATSNGTGINPDTGVADPTLTATDSSDDGTDPTTENGSQDTADGVFANDPTPLAPIAVDDMYTGNEDTPVVLDPLSNDFPGGGVDTVEILNIPDATIEGTLTYVDDLTGSTITVAPGMVLSVDEVASLMFNPAPDFNGPVTTIGYEVTDVNGDTTQAVIDITITPTPDAVDDPFTTNEDTPVNVSPLDNDDDGAGIDSVTINTIPDPAEGILTYLDASGIPVTVTPGTVLTPAQAATLEFTPEEDFNGPITPIEYTLTGVNGATSDAQITVDVIPTPDAVDDSFVTNEDTPILLSPLTNDDLADGADSVTVNNIPDPAVEGILTYLDAIGNSLTVMAGDVLTPEQATTLTFAPVEDFFGTVPPINYTVTDVNGETSDADIFIEVTPTPDAVDDSFVTNEDTPVLLNPLANDDLGAGAQSLTINNIPDPALEGTLTYLDAAGNPVTVMAGDVLTPEQAATLTFVPVMDFNGTVPPINYTVTDVNGETSAADIFIEVTPAPDAVDDTFVTNEDTPVAVDPLANDDVGPGAASVTINNVPDPVLEGEYTYIDDITGLPVTVAAGAVLSPTEAASMMFIPVADFNGMVTTVMYTVTDINGETSDANIDITITPTPDAEDDEYTGIENMPVALDPLSNDDLGAGADSVEILNVPDAATEGTLTYIDELTGAEIPVAPGAVLTPAEAASLIFNPVADFNGPVTPIGYEVTDINGETSDAVIDITITPTPDAVDDPFTTNEDTPVNVSPLGNDDDGAGVDSVTVNTIPDPAEGILTYLDASGNPVTVTPGTVLTAAQAATLEFTPEEDFNGPITPIEYTLTDINGATSDAEITVDVIPTPDAEDDIFTTPEDTPVPVNPLTNDDDGAGIASVTVDTIPDPSEGVLTYLDAAGNPVTVAPGDVLTPEQAATLVFAPAADFNGPVTPIEYTLTDINGAESSAEIAVDVTPAPDAVDDAVTTTQDSPVSLDPLANDDLGAGAASVTVNNVPDPAVEGTLTYTDADGNIVTVSPGDVLTPEQAATLTFVPVTGFSGTVPPVSYTVEDVNGQTSNAVIDITVIPTSRISGSVFQDDNGNGIQDPGEAGIPGVEITLSGVDNDGNSVELTVLTDANGNYVFDGLTAGTYSIFQTQPEGFDDGIASSDVAASIGFNQLNDIVLGVGDNFTSNSFSEIARITNNGTSGRPAVLPPLGQFSPQRLSNRISGFLGGPGPIYSGVPIASNGNPLTLDSGRPVTGGYATEFASAEVTGDCGCPEGVETPSTVPMEEEVIEDCNVCEDSVTEVVSEGECQTCEGFSECNECSDCGNCCDCGSVAKQGGFLFRFKHWMQR